MRGALSYRRSDKRTGFSITPVLLLFATLLIAMPSQFRYGKIVFTVNNFTDEESTGLKTWVEQCDEVDYAICGIEEGESGTPHLQGAIFMNSKKFPPHKGTHKFWKNIPGLKRSHLEPAAGNQLQNKLYCTKDGSVLFEVGKVKSTIKDRLADAMSKECFTDAVKAFPEQAVKSFGSFKAMYDLYNPTVITSPIEVLRVWQKRAIVLLEEQNNRQILFVVDPEGGAGKSYLVRHLVAEYQAFFCQGGKSQDIAHAISKCHPLPTMFLFDMARSNDQDWFPWNLIENLKNQMFSSTKYDSKSVILPFSAKVAVFMNEYPNKQKLTNDRYQILSLVSMDHLACGLKNQADIENAHEDIVLPSNDYDSSNPISVTAIDVPPKKKIRV